MGLSLRFSEWFLYLGRGGIACYAEGGGFPLRARCFALAGHTPGNVLHVMREKFGRRFLHEIFPNEETAADFTAILRQQAAKSEGSPCLDRQARIRYNFEGDIW